MVSTPRDQNPCSPSLKGFSHESTSSCFLKHSYRVSYLGVSHVGSIKRCDPRSIRTARSKSCTVYSVLTIVFIEISILKIFKRKPIKLAIAAVTSSSIAFARSLTAQKFLAIDFLGFFKKFGTLGQKGVL